MDTLSWRSSLAVQGYLFPPGDRVSVAVGLVDNAAGAVTVALRVGVDGPWVLLPVHEARRLASNVGSMLAERFQLAAAKLGDRADEGDEAGEGGRP